MGMGQIRKIFTQSHFRKYNLKRIGMSINRINTGSSIVFPSPEKRSGWHEFLTNRSNVFAMHENTTELARRSFSIEAEESSSFSQYLSFRFYRENLDQLKDRTKDSINNFLKTISEIEEEFLIVLQNQQMKKLELQDLGFDDTNTNYMEENY